MSEHTANKAVEYAARVSLNTGIIFFGGEPLLRKDLIVSTINFCKSFSAKTGRSFHFKVTTNGLLLDESFLEYANKAGLIVGLSIDGIKTAHNTHRKNIQGMGTFDELEPKIELLLKFQPYSSALMVVAPKTLEYYSESVKFLIQKGFRYIVTSLNYAGNWQDNHIRELSRQYRKLAKLYKDMVSREKKFYFSPFEVKFATYIIGEGSAANRCALGKRQISIAPDGMIYPCVQFVKDGVSNQEYCIGNVFDGIDEGKRDRLYELSLKKDDTCQGCAFSARCNNHCGCLNWQAAGSVNTVSPFLCESERLLIPIVDKLGNELYKKRAPMFIQKHYNAVYPVMSFLEDKMSG